MHAAFYTLNLPYTHPPSPTYAQTLYAYTHKHTQIFIVLSQNMKSPGYMKVTYIDT